MKYDDVLSLNYILLFKLKVELIISEVNGQWNILNSR